MTVALGYHCDGGVVVSADTLLSHGDGSATEGTKLHRFVVGCGSFAIAYASEDADATITLVKDVERELAIANIAYPSDLELVLRQRMGRWCSGFGKLPVPPSALIVGVSLQKARAPRLYLCEPPNTVVEKDDYIAKGSGSSVTDPLYETLFKGFHGRGEDVHTILRRVAYLVYRAKEHNIFVGKNTDAAIVYDSSQEPEYVRKLDMANVERDCKYIDTILSLTARILLSTRGIGVGNPHHLIDLLASRPSALTDEVKNVYSKVINIKTARTKRES